MPNATLAALLLTNRLVAVDAEPLRARDYWGVAEHVDDLGQLFEIAPADMPGALGISEELATRIGCLLDASTAFAMERERLESAGIRMLASCDPEFPIRLRERLGDAAPPMLYVAGDRALLRAGGLGVVGSRDVAPAGADVAQAAARAGAAAGKPVVSGLARGVDQLAMAAALDADGLVVGITAEGLARVSRSAAVRAAVAAERMCIATPYAPDAGFNAGNAMGRNKIIYALADLTLVVASDHETGGTWSGAKEVLQRGFGAVAVWRGEGEGPGNAALEGLGAVPVTSVDEIVSLLDQPPTPGPRPTQLGLGLA